MPVNTKHPSYQRVIGDMIKVQDAIDGEAAIKEKGPVYLPVPPAIVVTQPSAHDRFRGGDERYHFYMDHAEFPELPGPMLQAILGIVHEKPPEITLPPQLEYLREDATVQGETLFSLWKRVTEYVMKTGRAIMVTEIGHDDPRPRICDYPGQALINWRLLPVSYGSEPEMCVIEEALEEKSPDDPFVTNVIQQFRELRLVDGVYGVRIWRQTRSSGSGEASASDFMVVHVDGSDAEGWVFPSLRGKVMPILPIDVINSTKNGFEFGTIPMLPFARLAIGIYRKSADYNRALYMKSDPQVVITGVPEEEGPRYIGGGGAWIFTDPAARAYYLDIDGLGIPLLRESIQDKYQQFYDQGGRIMDSGDSFAESGRAIQERRKGEQVTVMSTLDHAAEGIEGVIRRVGRLQGIGEEALKEVKFIPNKDWAEGTLTPDEARSMIELWIGGHISKRTVHRRLVLGDVTDKTFEEEVEEIAQEKTDGIGPPEFAEKDLDPQDDQEEEAPRDEDQEDEQPQERRRSS